MATYSTNNKEKESSSYKEKHHNPITFIINLDDDMNPEYDTIKYQHKIL